jgi:DNA helicase HerA-like ATPase
MFDNQKGLYVAHSAKGAMSIIGKMANRHGLIAGATGTGKTVTLQVIAETFSQAGVPCFMADMKGDLSGISQAGAMNSFIEKRCAEFGIEKPAFAPAPTRFFDVYGEQGHPMRTTISKMGPLLLSRLLELNDIQDGVLNIVFRIADEKGLLLIDTKDLRSMLNYVSKHAAEYTTTYGNISSASIGAIQRALLNLESQGADKFFGEPDFDIFDLLQVENGKGIMNVLEADKLMHNPKLYSTFLLWLLSELYSQLPEVGDMDLHKLIFFFDEAHMLFNGTSKALVDKIEQVVRLIRSKGVGIYFVTQNPTDIPENILSQLGNRVQHALRAFTPKDQKAVRVAAETFRANSEFKTEDAIMELSTGEALVSFLDEKGSPSIVERAKILFPLSQIGAISETQRTDIINRSRLYGKYDKAIDRESAFEVLLAQQEELDRQLQAENEAKEQEKEAAKGKKKKSWLSAIFSVIIGAIISSFGRSLGNQVAKSVTGSSSRKKNSSAGDILKDATGKAISSATRSAASKIGRDILGNMLK